MAQIPYITGTKPPPKPAGNPFANIQVKAAPKVTQTVNLVRPTVAPPTDERRFIGLRPPVPVSPTIYDGIRKVNPSYKDPKVNLNQQMNTSMEKELHKEANRLLVDRYGDPREKPKGNPLVGFSGDASSDALRHAGTAMVASSKVGWPLANIAGLGHELMTGLDGSFFSKTTGMDLRNNFMGSMAGMAPTEKERMDRLDYLYKNGWIQTLNPPSSIKMPNYTDILNYMIKMLGLNNAKRKTSRR